jgi:hypothetical protein
MIVTFTFVHCIVCVLCWAVVFSLQEETRIVRMVLGDTSIGISSAFSSDLMSTTPFRYIKAPKELKEQAEEQAAKRKRMPTESELFGTYASNQGQELVYRVKKSGAYGGYKIMKTVCLPMC